MNKKDWYKVGGMLVLPIAADQFFKWLFALWLGGKEMMLGPIGLSIKQKTLNLAGQFNITEYIAVVSSFGFCVFFLFLFFVLNAVITQKALGLRLSAALFTAGMLSDAGDVLFRGGVVNWIKLMGLQINFSDIYIFAGALLTLFFCIKDRAVLFRKHNLRKKMFVEKDQYIFCFYTLAFWLFLNSAFYIFFFSFIKIIFNHFVTASPILQSQIVSIFSVLFFILSACFLLIMIAFAVYLSNKIYGPVYAFKKYIKDIFLNGHDQRPFKLRKGDHFKDLPDLIQSLRSKYLEKEEKDK